jgi:thiol:disulfide interchange protein DsbD
VLAEQPAPNMSIARLFNNAVAALPKPLQGWQVTASRTATAIVVRLTPAAGNTDKPQDLHLFDAAALVDYAAPQPVTEESGSLVLTLAPAKDAPTDVTRLSGVLVSGNGWGGLIPSHGATFDVPLEAAASNNVRPSTSNAQHSGSSPQVSGLRSQPSTAPAAGLAGTLFLAFVGGLILNLMPCVFPVLGIKILGFVNQSGNDRKKIVAHGLTFSLGVLLSFWSLAGLLLALRAGGAQLGWGFQLQSPVFVFGMTAFLLVFALNLSGLFEVGLSATAVGGKLQMQSGYAGSFFTGILATLVATPCSAPFLAPALGAALALSPVESFAVFTAIAVGLSLPYLLLSAFPQAIKLLPRPGAWMETFKQLMAFPLYATVGWLLWVLAGQTKDSDYALLLIILGLVLVAMAGWVYGKFTGGLGRVFTIVLAAAGLWVGWPKAVEAAPASASGYVLKWEHWSPEAVKAAQAAGRTVYVDFTARWCATCQTNKAAVFSSGDVLAALDKKNVLLLKADWTSRDPAITEELAKWNRSAVPFNLVYSPGQPDPAVLPELLTPGIVLEALGAAK